MKKIIVLIVALLCVLCSAALAENEPLFVARDGVKQGFINAQGEWVIEPQYEKVWPFTDAGYAAVIKTLTDPLWYHDPFTLIDRQGNVIADMPEWSLDIKGWYDTDHTDSVTEINAAGSAFVLNALDDTGRKVLYMADTGEMTELNRAFLGYELSPGAEEYAAEEGESTDPREVGLFAWEDRLVLIFEYKDYPEGKTEYSDCFVILDRQGHKVHDGCFDGDLYELWATNSQDPSKDQIKAFYLMTGSRSYKDNRPVSLIDRNGEIVSESFDENDISWSEELQAFILHKTGEAIMPDGRRITVTECIGERAKENPCGLVVFIEHCYDSNGEKVILPGTEKYGWSYISQFGGNGLVWMALGEGALLVNKEGKIIAEKLEPVLKYYEYSLLPLFSDGWECVYSAADGECKYGYIDASGEKMYGKYLFKNAEPFCNGLGHVQILNERYETVNAYINTEGKVVWAENGLKEEIQRMLDEGRSCFISDMTPEDAAHVLAGEWDCSGGAESIGYPVIFYEDGTCNVGDGYLLNWKVIRNTDEDDEYLEDRPFLLIFGDEDGFYEEGGFRLGIISGDSFSIWLRDCEGGSAYIRINPGTWEKRGFRVVPDENGRVDMSLGREPQEAAFEFAAEENEPLFVAKDGMKAGFINAQGEWVIEPKYEKVWPFTDAGYAAVVETVYDPYANRDSFMLIDKQGNTVAELPDWSLYIATDFINEQERACAVENAFVVWDVKGDRYALYLADTGEMIELDQAFLGYELTPGAEEYATQESWFSHGTNPYDFCLCEWNDHLVLEFTYNDFYKEIRDYEFFAREEIKTAYCGRFVILDRQGHKLHEGCFEGKPMQVSDFYQIRDTYILTGNKLIDSDGKVILDNLTGKDMRWEEEIQAISLNTDEVMLPDGQIKPFEEHLKQLASQKADGMGLYSGWYYNAEGEMIEDWQGEKWRKSDPSIEDDFGWQYMALTEFGEDGLAWVDCWWTALTYEITEDRLVDKDGRIFMTVNLVPEQHNQYVIYPEASEFEYGWECVYSDDWMFGYINPSGEMMFGGYLFRDAKPFRNGLAYAQFMDDRCELLDVYINPEGKVVWAEYGKKEEVQRWLDEGKVFSVNDLTLEEATKALAGEWDCTGGGEMDPFILYEDGTGTGVRNNTFTWRLVDNRDGSAVAADVEFWKTGADEEEENLDEEDTDPEDYDEDEWDDEEWIEDDEDPEDYDEDLDEEERDEEEDEDEEPYWLEFLLVYGDGEITCDNTEILIFMNRDEFFFSDGQGSSSFGRVPTGALERWGYMGAAAEAAE